MVETIRRLGGRIQIIGDDYLTTNAGLIRAAGARGACNAVLLKSNQCGTLSELIERWPRRGRWAGPPSCPAGSGESEDVTLSHLAVGLFLPIRSRSGSITRAERTAKWNELIRIEEAFAPGAMWRFRVPG